MLHFTESCRATHSIVEKVRPRNWSGVNCFDCLGHSANEIGKLQVWERLNHGEKQENGNHVRAKKDSRLGKCNKIKFVAIRFGAKVQKE